MPLSTKSLESLLRAYEGLPDSEKRVLAASAVLGGTASHHRIADYFKRSTGDTSDPWKLTQAVKTAWKSLVSRGLALPYEGCHPLLLHPLTIAELQGPEAEKRLAAARASIRHEGFYLDEEVAGDLLRLDFYGPAETDAVSHMKEFSARFGEQFFSVFLVATFGPAELGIPWLSSRRVETQVLLAHVKATAAIYLPAPPPDIREVSSYFRERRNQPEFAPAVSVLADVDLLSFRLDEARQAVEAHPGSPWAHSVQATIAFLRGDLDGALRFYREALAKETAERPKAKLRMLDARGVFFRLCLVLEGSPGSLDEALKFCSGGPKARHPLSRHFASVEALAWFRKGLLDRAKAALSAERNRPASSGVLGEALLALAEWLIEPGIARTARSDLERAFSTSMPSFPVIGRVYAEILDAMSPRDSAYRDYLKVLDERGMISFLPRFASGAVWQRKLQTLQGLLRKEETVSRPLAQRAKRLVYLLEPRLRTIRVLEQTAKGTGYSSGRDVSLARLASLDPRLDFLTDTDRRVAAAISSFRDWRGHQVYQFEFNKAMRALVGSSCVYLESRPSEPVDLLSAEPELIVREEKGSFRIKLSHFALPYRVALEEEPPSRVRVVFFSEKTRPLEELLTAEGILVPAEGRAEVLSLLQQSAGPVAIRAEVQGLAPEAAEAQSRPVLQFVPKGGTLSARIVVRPFGTEGPVNRPAEGGSYVIATIGGRQRRAARNLDREKGEAGALVAACPSLESRFDGSFEFEFLDLEESLALLEEVQAYTGPVSIEWPAGQPLSLSGAITPKSLKLKISTKEDWFSVEGKVSLDEDLVLDFAALLKKLPEARGRFVPLGDGKFLALSANLKRQLERLQSLSHDRNGAPRLHHYSAGAIEDLVEEAGHVETDAAWDRVRNGIREALAWTPTVPKLFEGELRDYQVEGYRWMARLARLGAGACLADDMGLGKTVQAIALMVERAKEGPCLVIAPTSVCHNWEDEIEKFAPALEVHRLRSAEDRSGLVEALGPMSVLIVSYTLLHLESGILSGKDWSMAILDEAQAIKNAETRRAQASLKLRAGFRLALSGTPVENYLEDLWSLFNFVNPGLLGSREAFQKRFVARIAAGDGEARQTLKLLIRPFLLRRTKNAVLAELPERIEKTIAIELPGPERAFYEALRKEALEKLEGMDETAPGQRKIHIFAELTRLRRACCHPRLVVPEVALPSAKLAAFLELALELKKSNHRALVFSQFVSYLALVRQELEKVGVAYQYLDGQTPGPDRERRVRAFQSGEGDLFLISLKAGGTGLNLTAADYVFHLDPWWNPAVEDQAADRAHRIGQTRPVTIYRLVSENTIEEKIVRLHKGKRELANEILSGADVAARMTEEDLIDLMRT